MSSLLSPDGGVRFRFYHMGDINKYQLSNNESVTVPKMILHVFRFTIFYKDALNQLESFFQL